MANKNRYKFHFGEKNLTLTTDKDNLFMEEVERVAHEKYKIIKEQMKNADNETIAILTAALHVAGYQFFVNSVGTRNSS